MKSLRIVKQTSRIHLKHMAHTFRYKISPDLLQSIKEFAQNRRYLDRASYTHEWQRWCQTNEIDIKKEQERLEANGYKGDIERKLFKSGRYYFCKLTTANSATKTPTSRKPYISIGHALIHVMNTHIHKNMTNENYTPASGYVDFCLTHKELLQIEIKKFCCKNAMVSSNHISQKIKKTYKNRYYLISNTKKIEVKISED